MPLTSVATTLRAQAMASSGTSAMPSQRDGTTTTSAAAIQSGTSVRAPANSTPATPSASRSRARRSGPSPTRTSCASGTRARTSGQSASRSCWPFCTVSAPTQSTIGTSSSPSSLRAWIRSRAPGRAELGQVDAVRDHGRRRVDAQALAQLALGRAHADQLRRPSAPRTAPSAARRPGRRCARRGRTRRAAGRRSGSGSAPPAARPARPCRCAGARRRVAISLTIRFSRTTAPGSVLSSASARHHRTAAPASRAAYPRSPCDGQATVTFQPRSTWSRT